MSSDKKQLRRAAIALNSMNVYAPASTGAAFRAFGYNTRVDLPATAGVAEEFLVASRYRRRDLETDASIATFFTDPMVLLQALADKAAGPESGGISLPRPSPLRMDVGAAIAKRRSVRQFTGDELPFAHLSAIVRAMAGVTHSVETHIRTSGETVTFEFRAAPSGGGLYPIELWLAVRAIKGLEPGVYRYAPRSDQLLREGGRDKAEAVYGTFAVPEDIISVSRSAAILLLLARPMRSMAKYGPRGLRHVFIEAGAMAENVHLAATSIGIGSVDCASFVDSELSAALDIDGVEVVPVHSILLGESA
jgi:SagB-type dehydrogenase family enzyme